MINNKKLRKELCNLADYLEKRRLTVMEIKLVLNTFLGVEESKTIIRMVEEELL